MSLSAALLLALLRHEPDHLEVAAAALVGADDARVVRGGGLDLRVGVVAIPVSATQRDSQNSEEK